MSTEALPPGVVILPSPFARAPERHSLWDSRETDDDAEASNEKDRREALLAAAWPEPPAAGSPAELAGKMFACSGAPESSRYQQATRYRDPPGMTWEEARACLNRLLLALSENWWRRAWASSGKLVALAEFALTVAPVAFAGTAADAGAAPAWTFVGRKGDHAAKLREELNNVTLLNLQARLHARLHDAEAAAQIAARPITACLRVTRWGTNDALQTVVPDGARWASLIALSPAGAIAALDHLRVTLAQWTARREFADGIERRLDSPGSVTAAEYAEAIHIADLLEFASAKLASLYAGFMHSMPVYRLFPWLPEREAVDLWWPWGREAPLVARQPGRPGTVGKRTLDPSSITATQPHHVVREVIERTGMNRTTAQRLTAELRAKMRRDRLHEAVKLLACGATRADVARTVGLSPSRVSAMFKGRKFQHTKQAAKLAAELLASRQMD